MKQPKIVFLDRDSFESSIEFSPPQIPHEWVEYAKTSATQVVERSKNADAIIGNKVKLTADILEQLPKLKMISVTATGTNNVDLDYCRAHRIPVTNVTNYGTSSIAEHTFMLILALRRKLIPYHQAMQQDKWVKSTDFCYFDEKLPYPMTELAGSRLGVIGAGTIGREMGRIAEAFGMEVVYANRSQVNPTLLGKGKQIGLAELIQTSDVITLHLPLNDESKDLIALPELQQMKKSILLINTARGGIVNEMDLVTALKNHEIAGVGFDVLSEEPPTGGNPLLDLAKTMPNVLVTPHVAWAGKKSATNSINFAINHLEKFFRGEEIPSLTT